VLNIRCNRTSSRNALTITATLPPVGLPCWRWKMAHRHFLNRQPKSACLEEDLVLIIAPTEHFRPWFPTSRFASFASLCSFR
jgi:hypothetical protein